MELKTPPFFYTLPPMSTNYEAPSELRELEKILRQFTYANGYDMTEVFNDMLRYIVGFFTWEVKPIESWRYKKEDTIVFWNMLTQWLSIMNRQTIRKEWYDAFGDLYMALIGSTSRIKGFGQNFTPSEICEPMAEITGTKNLTEAKEDDGGMISDPTCGSGRTLLAAHIRHPKKYIVAEDIDKTCCMMTVCNFIIHGCRGEVIWHNSLEPESYSGGWLVNEHLGKCGLPSVREIPKEESVLWNFWQHRKQETDIQVALKLNMENQSNQLNKSKITI